MDILITGGNGLLGRHLIPALENRGYGARVLALPTEDTSYLEQRGVAVVRGDITKPPTLPGAFAGVKAVVHLAGMMGVWRPIEAYHAVNVKGTENVCRAALAAGVRRVVHTSSWTVYGIALGTPAREDFLLTPFREPYAITKAAGDALVQRMIVEERLPAVIVRPGTFFGPGDRLHFARMAARVSSGRAVIVGRGDNALPFVYVTDVVQGLLRALEGEAAIGQAYNITNDQPLTQQEFLQAIADELRAGPPRIHLPYRDLYAAGYAAERFASLTRTRRPPVLTRLGVKLFGTDNRHSIEKAGRELGYKPQVTLREGIRLAADWYRADTMHPPSRRWFHARLVSMPDRHRRHRTCGRRVGKRINPMTTVCSAVLLLAVTYGTALAGDLATRPRLKTFKVPPPGDPWGTAIARSGNVWFADPRCDVSPTCPSTTPPGKIGELNPSSGHVKLYRLPNIPGNQPVFLVFDSAGHLWFTTPNNGKIGEFNPSTHRFIGQWAVTRGSGPWDLTFAQGKLWYTDYWASAVSVFDISRHKHHDFPTPSHQSHPYGIAASGRLIWFTENNRSVDRVAVLNLRSEKISEYPIVLPMSGTPHMIAIGPQGHPWWTEGAANTIGTLNPAAATPGRCGAQAGSCNGVRRFSVPFSGRCAPWSHVSAIAVQRATGRVWLDDSLSAEVGAFSPADGTFALTPLRNCLAHPHDGLSLSRRGDVWFDEEFGNAIGELIP
jgi:nucleoside-diphosphate-sugar epimerase/streptogramin lyase